MSRIVISDLNQESTLTSEELEQIWGGLRPTPESPVSGWFSGSTRLATRLTAVGAVWGAFQAGWEAGQWLNENTPIQSWISNALE
ncbi:hypothetical protein [Microseira sp. BLCC-F43]|jgi:hypothetical protein|uniref:hypothetical protein n=1 Tax=Microseira sp. BLCC-F43 TaxID=3153602 RepID=UPI0035B81B90